MIVEGGELAEFMLARIGLPISPETIYIGAQRKDLSIAAAVAYNCWLEDSVFMHVCFDAHAVPPEIIREAFMYPFVTCGKARVYGMTPITSKRALVFSKRLGFREVIRTPDFLLQVMSKDECRWIHDTTNRTRSDLRASTDAAGAS